MAENERHNPDAVPRAEQDPPLPQPRTARGQTRIGDADVTPSVVGAVGVQDHEPQGVPTNNGGSRILPPHVEDALVGTAPPSGAAYSNTYGRAGFYQSYLYSRRSVWASSVGQGVMTYTFNHLSVAPDANGRRFVPQGTTLATYGSGGKKVGPRAGSSYAVGILDRDIDCTDSDMEIGMIVAGAVNTHYLWDAGTFGAADAGYVVGALPRIHFTPVDY